MEIDQSPPVRTRSGKKIPKTIYWGVSILVFIFALTIFGPYLSPYTFESINLDDRFLPPDSVYWLGTDEFGRDVFTRLLHGARLSLFMGFFATAISLMIGVPLGIAAGYFQGVVDEVIMRVVDVMISLPPIMLGLLILAVTSPSIVKSAIAVGIVYIPIMVRISRSVTLDLIHHEFIEAAKARGEKTYYILFSEILPNAYPPIIVEGALRITFAILLGAALSFLGLGAQPPSSDWGLMIAQARPFIYSAPWIVLAPGAALCITIIGINLLADGLREILDPRMKSRKE